MGLYAIPIARTFLAYFFNKKKYIYNKLIKKIYINFNRWFYSCREAGVIDSDHEFLWFEEGIFEFHGSGFLAAHFEGPLGLGGEGYSVQDTLVFSSIGTV